MHSICPKSLGREQQSDVQTKKTPSDESRFLSCIKRHSKTSSAFCAVSDFTVHVARPRFDRLSL